MRMITKLFLLSVLCLSSFVSSARILVLYPVASKSHKFAVMPIVEELAQRGHQITFVSPFKPSKSVENIHEIVLSELAALKEMTDVDWFAMTKAGPTQMIQMFLKMKQWISKSYEILMKNEDFLVILKERNVDLVIFNAAFNEFCLKISDQLKAPYIVHASGAGFFFMGSMGVSMDYATVPSLTSDFDDKMNFFQRMANMAMSEVATRFYDWFINGMIEEMTKKDFPDSRSIAELQKETSLAIINSHPATAYSRSLPPTVIPIGALHTRPAKPLPDVIHFNNFVI